MKDKSKSKASKTSGRVVEQNITDFAKRSLKIYADEVNLERATPDLIDGLKPVTRRIVYGASEVAKIQFVKSALVVGHVMGRYHPHGDCLEGDTLVYTLDGKFTKIKNMLDKGRKWILAYDPKTKQYVPAMAHSWRIGQHAKETYDIHLSDGSIINATANHPFFDVADDQWIKAKDLIANDELLGGHLADKGEYATLKTSRSSRPIHRIVGEFCHSDTEDGEVFHHANENKRDNRPKNLEITDRSNHAEDHSENYKEGLANGRKTMFEGRGKMRKAIAAKNSALMTTHNQWLWLTKAIKIGTAAIEESGKLTESSYDAARKSVYNGTTRMRLLENDVDMPRLLKLIQSDWKPSYESAAGHTAKLKKPKVKRVYSEEGMQHLRLPGFMDVVRYMKDRSLLRTATWIDYEKARSSLIAKHARTKGSAAVHEVEADTVRAYTSPTVSWLKENIGSTFSACLEFASPRHGIFVLNVVKREHKSRPMYDFTVDGYENMLIAIPRGESHTMVVAHNSSIYGAMVTSAQSTVPMIHGKGNWGSITDGAAAMRYTNCRLSEFARLAFDSNYANKEVTSFVPNYDDTGFEPVSIPFPLPVILFSGAEGIGYGAACVMPSFTPESVTEVLKRLLKGEKLKAEDFAKSMKPDFKWGGEFVKTKDNRKAWMEMFTGSKASVQFESPLNIDSAKHRVSINEWPQGVDPDKVALWARDLPETLEAQPCGSNEFEFTMRKGYNSVQFEAWVKKIAAKTRAKASYNINVTRRTATITDGVVDYTVTVHSLSVPQLVMMWLKERLATELRSLDYRIKKQNEAIRYSDLLILAASKLDIIVPIIRKSKDPKVEISKKLKISLEEANQILSLTLRRLTVLDQDAIADERKNQLLFLKQLEKWKAKPKLKMCDDIDTALTAIEADRKWYTAKGSEKLEVA